MIAIIRPELFRSGDRRRIDAALIYLVFAGSIARAEIYQWEFVDPSDSDQGKRPSATLVPDGAGVDAGPGADLSNRNLTMAYLIGAEFMSGNGSASNLTDVDMTCANLTDADLTQANLTSENFFQATLTNSDITSAEVRGARFGLCSPVVCRGSGINLAQLYSTASYQANDLSGIGLGSHDFAGGQFGRQNLKYADFCAADLTEANFREANLANAYFFGFRRSCHPLSGCNYVDLAPATLTGADFTSADTRGAVLSASSLSSTVTTNVIQPDGHVSGLDLDGGSRLVVLDYEGDSRFEPAKPPIPITVDQHLAMGPGGTLRMVFEADAWDSTISFAPGIPVTLGGTLELAFADGVDVATHVGRTFELFDWTGVSPVGSFAISSLYRWDLSNLYTTGEVTFVAVPEPRSLGMYCVALSTMLVMHRVRVTLGSSKGEFR